MVKDPFLEAFNLLRWFLRGPLNKVKYHWPFCRGGWGIGHRAAVD